MTLAPKSAFILAAGLGTRLRPLTDDRPKALVRVGNRALIDHMIDALKAVGVEHFVVNVHYFADSLESHLRQRQDVKITISDERALLRETGGGLKHARPLLPQNDPIFVANIDSVWLETSGAANRAIEGLIEAFDPHKMKACLLLAKMENSHGFEGAGDFFKLEDHSLRFRGEAPCAPYNYMGVHITQPDIADHIPKEVFSLSPLWRALAPQGRLHGVVADVEWMHVGDPDAKLYADQRFAEHA